MCIYNIYIYTYKSIFLYKGLLMPIDNLYMFSAEREVQAPQKVVS